MTAITATFTSLPFTQFRKHRHFYLWYDGVWAVLLAGVLALMKGVGHQPLVQGAQLFTHQLAKLRVYAGAEHPHEAQSPAVFDFKSLNRKNTRIG